MQFDVDFLDRIKDANNIVDVIGQYTTLKGSGNRYMGLCPFPDHKEKSPSFSVTADRGLYHCFGCKKSGDVITFLQEYSNLSFVESVELLANKARIPLPESFREDKKSEWSKADLLKVNKTSAIYFYSKLKELPQSSPVKKYLESRGLDEKLIHEFRLGYCDDGWNGLVDHLSKNKISLKLAEHLGLIKAKKSNQGYFDIFRSRIIFPIFSVSNEVVGFGGRIIDQGQPKYLNSPESQLFSKRKVFYGLSLSGPYIKQKDQVIVVEGYMDFIALYSKGIKNVVATLGTALTHQHLKVIERYTKNVVLLFDGDRAGRDAADRSLPIMLENNFVPKALFLPDDLDPDEFLKENSVENFLDLINNAKELFSQTLDTWMLGFKGSTGEKLQLMNSFKTLLESCQSRELKHLLSSEFADRIGEDVKWIERNMLQAPKQANLSANPSPIMLDNPQVPQITGQLVIKGSPIEEIYILMLSTKYLEFLEKTISSGVSEGFRGPNTRALLNMVIERYRHNPETFASMTSSVLTRVKDTENITLPFANFTGNEPQKDEIKLFEASLKRVLDSHLKLRMLALTSEIKNAGQGNGSSEKLEQIVNIQKDRRDLNKLLD